MRGETVNFGEKIDTGIWALAFLAQRIRVPIDPDAVSHELGLGHKPTTSEDIVRASTLVGLKARILLGQTEEKLRSIPRPAILRMRNGRYVVLGRRLANNNSLVFDIGRLGPLQFRTEQSFKELCSDWAGEIILITRTRAMPPGVSDVFGFCWFLPSIWRYRVPLVQVLIASLFVQFFTLFTPLLFQVVIDKVLVHNSSSTLTVIVISLLGLGVFDVILQYLRTYALFHTTNRIDVELGGRLFSHLMKLPYSYFETRPSGQTVARLGELETIRHFLTGQGLTSIVDLLFMFIYLGVLLTYSFALTMVTIASIPIYMIIAAALGPFLRDKINEKFNRGAETKQLLIETVVGAQTLKGAAVEPLIITKWNEKFSAYIRASFQAISIGSFGQNCIQYVSKATTALILLFGAKAVMAGTMTVGELIAFNMIAGQMVSPILRISQLWQDFQEVQISVTRLGDILNAQPEREPKSAVAYPAIKGSVEFNDVIFRYTFNAPAILKGISIKIEPGECIGIVGPSGSGKSTLTKLLQRFYFPEEGSISIDGVNISHVHPAWIRRQMGVVLQDTILFNGTIHENIALAAPNIDRSEVVRLAELAGADDFIRHMPLAGC